jgi:hypothetical protein
MDSWFSSVEKFEHIVKANKSFVAALKNNRVIAFIKAEKRQGRFVQMESLALSDKHAVRGWLKGYAHRAKLFIKATRQAYAELQVLRAA